MAKNDVKFLNQSKDLTSFLAMKRKKNVAYNKPHILSIKVPVHSISYNHFSELKFINLQRSFGVFSSNNTKYAIAVLIHWLSLRNLWSRDFKLAIWVHFQTVQACTFDPVRTSWRWTKNAHSNSLKSGDHQFRRESEPNFWSKMHIRSRDYLLQMYY